MAATTNLTTSILLNWLAYRRRRWLAGFVIAFGMIVAWTLWDGGDPEFVLYNKSSRALGPVRLMVAGATVDFPPLAAQQSVVRPLRLRAGGELGVWLSGDATQPIAGPWVEPGETAQVIVRVDEFGEVLFSQTPTWRARLVAALR
jgi:hypothetical protein